MADGSDDDGVAGLSRVEADGDARAGGVVALASALVGVERLGGLVVHAVEGVFEVDQGDRARVVGDYVEDGAFGDAARAEELGAARGLVVSLASAEDVEYSHARLRRAFAAIPSTRASARPASMSRPVCSSAARTAA